MASWMSAEAVQTRLKVKPQTLYAYVSRGLIASCPDPHEPRRSLYAAEDIDRLAERKAQGRRATVAHEAMSWGDPVLNSAIATISGGRLYYRGLDAMKLAETATLEATARLLWNCGEGEDPFSGLAPHPGGAAGPDGRTRAFLLLAQRAARDPVMAGRSEPALRREAAQILTELVDAVCGQVRPGLLHERLARAWRVEGGRADAIRRALVVCADHELNASTFAARVTASTGAPLAASALAGLSALVGPRHGGMTIRVAAFVNEAMRSADPGGAASAQLSRECNAAALHHLAQGLQVPGFGHPLYPHGDPRAVALAEAAPFSEALQAVGRVCQDVTGGHPNLDFALVALARTLRLPSEAPFLVFMLGRTAGWLAHALEHQTSGEGLIRPRARYTGVRVEAAQLG